MFSMFSLVNRASKLTWSDRSDAVRIWKWGVQRCNTLCIIIQQALDIHSYTITKPTPPVSMSMVQLATCKIIPIHLRYQLCHNRTSSSGKEGTPERLQAVFGVDMAGVAEPEGNTGNRQHDS